MSDEDTSPGPKPEPESETHPGARSGGVEFHGDGSVTIGGDVVGRDKIVQGDDITIGNVGAGAAVAAGRGAAASVAAGLAGADLNRLFLPLMNAIRDVPAEKQGEAMQKAETLKSEVAKGKDADDNRVARVIDGLVELVPGAVSAVVSMFASPILAGIVGPVTKFVLDKIQGK